MHTSTQLRAYSLIAGLAVVTILLSAAQLRAQRTAISQAYQLSHTAHYDPSLSPDGKKMVYITVIERKEQLFIMNVDGTASVQLTHDDADHEDPAWSPDGRQSRLVIRDNGCGQLIQLNETGALQNFYSDWKRTLRPTRRSFLTTSHQLGIDSF